MEPVKRKAGRPPKKNVAEKLGNSIKIEDGAARLLESEAKRRSMSKGKFASAAIAYCIELGIDPTAERIEGLASVGRKVGEGVASVRAHNADIGNRLYALVRGFEKTIYLFMQQQQLATNSYLESIESNLLRQLVSMEVNKLEPLIEHVFKTEQEAYITRGLGQRIFLEQRKDPQLWDAQNEKFNTERNEVVAARLREYVAEHKVPAPRPSPKPGVTPAPQKPVAATPTTPTTTPAPAKS